MNRQLVMFAALGAALIVPAVAVDAWNQEAMMEAAEVSTPAQAKRRMQVTATLPPPPTTTIPLPPHYSTWLRLAQCESGGDWQINTGNGYYGGLQFGLTSWRAVGGSGYPHQASMLEQMYRAERLLALQGWGAWPSCSRQLGLR